MTKAILISACGDPLLATFCIDLLKKNCWDEFDSLYICFNNYAESPKAAQVEFFARYADDPKIKIIYWPTQLGYGRPITKMVQVCEEDLVCLLEDDGFIVQKGAIASAFQQIEAGQVDALGSPRFSCGTEIAEALKQLYDLDFSGYGDKGPCHWPNFFFIKRHLLLKTDLNFGPQGFKAGKFYKELDHTMAQEEAADTFGWASIQLRHLGAVIGEIPQFHSSPYEIEEYEKKEGKWATRPYWIHGGSLSAGRYLKGELPDVSNETAKQEIESRVAWWMIIADRVEGFNDYKQYYKDGIAKLVENANLDIIRITQKTQIYRELIDG